MIDGSEGRPAQHNANYVQISSFLAQVSDVFTARSWSDNSIFRFPRAPTGHPTGRYQGSGPLLAHASSCTSAPRSAVTTRGQAAWLSFHREIEE